jgi:hypothetical protein
VTRRPTGTGYPHNNLNDGQREAIDRLDAPPVEVVGGWQSVWLTDPLPEGRKGLMFYPRKRRTWTLNIKGYPVVRVYGTVEELLCGRFCTAPGAVSRCVRTPGPTA